MSSVHAAILSTSNPLNCIDDNVTDKQIVQWNLRTRDALGLMVLSLVERR